MTDTTDVAITIRPTASPKSKFREYTESIFWGLAIFFFIQTCVIQAFKIPSGSMVDTLVIGDRLFVNKFIYGIKVPFTNVRLPELRKPERGDVVVFRYPQDRTQDFIKRLVGVPGDIIDIRDKKVYVNGTVDSHHVIHSKSQQGLPVRQ